LSRLLPLTSFISSVLLEYTQLEEADTQLEEIDVIETPLTLYKYSVLFVEFQINDAESQL
jgi:hypothetical protein